MAKVRHKSNGCRRGKFKAKRMGKGWSTLRKPRGRPLPVKRDAEPDPAIAAPAAAPAS